MQYELEKSAIDMDKRRSDLLELSSYIQTVDNDVTMILQSLQWDRKHLMEASPMVSCENDQNHRVPPDKIKDHEKDCYLRSLGYSKEDLLLPEPQDTNANTLIKLILQISLSMQQKLIQVLKKRVQLPADAWADCRGGEPTAPLSLSRLQHAYNADERRALHDAAVSAALACHDLGELALLGGDGETEGSKQKSRAEILAELRDMKRRRTKYRVAAKTRNYSAVLRDVIATQMEHYTEAQNGNSTNKSQNMNMSKTDKPQQYGDAYVKKEPLEQGSTYPKEKETKRNSDSRRDKSRDETRHRDNIRDDTRQRDNSRGKTRRGDNFKDETCHRDYYRDETRHKDNFRDETRHRDNFRDETRHRDKPRDETRYEDYKRHYPRDERRYRDEEDRHSSSSKDRSRDKNYYRTSDRYKDGPRDSRKDCKNYESSRNTDVRYKREDEAYEKSYREEKRIKE